MALIQWTDALSVKIKEIDTQHQRLVKMVNDLDDAMRAGQGKEILKKIVDGLIHYTTSHFSTEEKYFDQFGYPESPAHKSEHRKFLQEVSRFQKEFQEGKLGLSIQVMNFLGHWLKKHILGTDQKYSPFLLQNGLK